MWVKVNIIVATGNCASGLDFGLLIFLSFGISVVGNGVLGPVGLLPDTQNTARNWRFQAFL
jgi:hypothetical protein